MHIKLSDRWNQYTIIARGGGAGGGTTKSYSTSLPEYAEPFYTSMMERSEAVSNQDYVPYEGPRIADWTDPQLLAQAGTEYLASTGNPLMESAGAYSDVLNALSLDQATQGDQVFNTYAGAQNYDPLAYDPYMVDLAGNYADTSGGFIDPNGYNVDASGMYVNAADYNDVSTPLWGEAWREHYMSPYMDAVVQRAQEDAILEDQRQKAMRDTEAVMAGAYSGDRRFVSDALYGESLLNRLNDIQTGGLQSAYENAQGMFTSDMARKLQADIAGREFGLQAGLGNLNAYMQGELANQGNYYDALRSNLQSLTDTELANLDAYTRSQLANQQAAYDAANLGEQSRQFGAGLLEEGRQFGSDMDYQAALANEDLQLQALQQLLGSTQLQGALGIDDQNAYLSRMAALNDVGNAQMARQQDVYDQAYEDFINQRDYDRQTLQWLSSQLQGVPVSTQADVVQYQQTPSLLSTMLGSALSGYGLYNQFA